MKLFLAALLLAYSAVFSAAASSNDVQVSMLDIDDIESNHRVVIDSSDPALGNYYGAAPNKGPRGDSFVNSKLKAMLQNSGSGASLLEDPTFGISENVWHQVQTTYLTGTSHRHQDYKANGGCGNVELVDDTVGFVVLNNNDNAYFDHPSKSVPFRKGAFIRFKGSDPHRTGVNKGHVHILGPFDMNSFSKVGDDSPTYEPTNEPTYSPTYESTTMEPTTTPTDAYVGPTAAPTVAPSVAPSAAVSHKTYMTYKT